MAEEKKWSWWQSALGWLRKALNKGAEYGLWASKGKDEIK